MTRQELQTKYPTLLTPETAAMMAEIAHHLRACIPMPEITNPIDKVTAIRTQGFMQGWILNANQLHTLHLVPQTPTVSQQKRPYSEPQVAPKPEGNQQ